MRIGEEDNCMIVQTIIVIATTTTIIRTTKIINKYVRSTHTSSFLEGQSSRICSISFHLSCSTFYGALDKCVVVEDAFFFFQANSSCGLD